jgi:hypothetical protein
MKILSIDVGIKNLAYCLIEVLDVTNYKIIQWDVINLCGEAEETCNFVTKKGKCSHKAKYYKNEDRYCLSHAKKSQFLIPSSLSFTLSKLKNYKISELLTIVEQFNLKLINNENKQQIIDIISAYTNTNKLEYIISSSKSANDMNLVSIGIELNKQLNEHIPNLDGLDHVIIENQIGPIAIRMKSIQGMITQYFIMKNITNITFVSSANKLKRFINTKTTYDERKKIGINITKDILAKKESEWLDVVATHKKRDDLADSFLQGLWFLENKRFIDIII